MRRIEKPEGTGRVLCTRPEPGRSGRYWLGLWLIVACLAWWRPAWTGEEEPGTTASAEPEATAAADIDALLSEMRTISDDELDSERAKAQIEVEKIVINDQDLNGVVSENTAINTVSGNNTITGDAFRDSSGFVSSVQNTGNNVLIQNATIVNIEVQP